MNLFDTKARLTYQGQSPNTTGEPIIPTGYQPRRPGLLTNISNVGTGILDPFLQAYGQGGYYDKVLAQQQANEMADMEFRKFLIQNQTKLQQTNTGTPVFTIDPETNSLVSIGNTPKGSKVISPMSMQSPQEKANLAIQSSSKKKLNESFPSIASTLQAFDDLEGAAKGLPNFESGIIGQTGAKVQTTIGKYSADKRFTDFEAALSKAFAPSTRSIMQEVGTLNEGDIERSKIALGKAELPIESKLSNIQSLRGQLISGLEARLNASGLDWEYVKNNYPKIYDKIFPSRENNIGSSNQPLIPLDELLKRVETKKAK